MMMLEAESIIRGIYFYLYDQEAEAGGWQLRVLPEKNPVVKTKIKTSVQCMWFGRKLWEVVQDLRNNR